MINKYALLLQIIKELNSVGSWSGNTHIQKTVSLVQSILGEEIYKFTIHHYGPYSFELRDDLERLVSVGFVTRTFDDFGYHYKITEKGLEYLQKNFELNYIADIIKEVAFHFGRAPTYVLELFSTIDYALRKYDTDSEKVIVEYVKRLKPHFSETVIAKALEMWKDIRFSILEKSSGNNH